MYRITFVLISFYMAGCTVESAKCTRDDVVQLVEAGYTKNEINQICSINGLQQDQNNTLEKITTVNHQDINRLSIDMADEPGSDNDETDTGSDLESRANKLYVEASSLVQKIKDGTGSYEKDIPLYRSALNKLERITSDYAESNMAVAVISDQLKIAGFTLSELEQTEISLLNHASEGVSGFHSPKKFDRNHNEDRIYLELGESYGNYTLEPSGKLKYGAEYLFDHNVLYNGPVSSYYKIHLGHVSNNGTYQLLYAGGEKGDGQMLVYFLKTGYISKAHPLMSAYAAGFGVWNRQSTKAAIVSGGELPDLSVFNVEDESWVDFHFYREVEPWGLEGVFDQSVNDCGWQVIDNLKWISENKLRIRFTVIENPWGHPDTDCKDFVNKIVEVTADANTTEYTIIK